MTKLPVTIVSPVMNCISGMLAHAEHLRLLSGMVSEVIVVDSQSSDGTIEYLRDALADLEIRFLDHPPGLYQSWNFGISMATQPFLTMATVGDILPPESLARLYVTLHRFSADVVVSAPAFVNMDGTPSKKRWPIHQLLDRVRFDNPFEMDSVSWITTNYGFYSASLIASSASNLYRTSLLQEHPFPTDLRHWGDIAWALTTGHLAKWVIDPGVKSTFLLHPRPSKRLKSPSDDFDQKRASLAGSYFESHRQMLVEAGVPADVMKAIGHAVGEIQTKHRIRTLYKSLPTRWQPWFMSPRAIRLRRERARVEVLMRKRRDLVLEYIAGRLNETQRQPSP